MAKLQFLNQLGVAWDLFNTMLFLHMISQLSKHLSA
jgi:hypothetical protein